LTKLLFFDKKEIGDSMNVNGKITVSLLILVVLISLPLIVSPVFADDTLRSILAKKYSQEKDICPVVKETITDGQDTKEVTKTCIQMGHDACIVIKCAIEANGNLEQIITGALEAGTTPDVCSRCALEAGADPQELARLLEAGLGYTPALAPGLASVEMGPPGGGSAGGKISPSSF